MNDSDLPFVIEPMALDDIPQVVAVERASYTMTWPKKAYEYELTQNRLAHYVVLRLLVDRLPALDNPPPHRRPVIGLAGLWLMADEAHISTIAVLPCWRGLGLGERLLQTLLDRAMALDAVVATLEVRPSNQAARSLYRKYRFVEVGRRPRYYSDNQEDALILTSPPLAAPDYQTMLARRKAVICSRLKQTPLHTLAQLARNCRWTGQPLNQATDEQ